MKKVERRVFELAVDELNGVEDIFFKAIQMDREKALKRFSGQIKEAHETLVKAVKIRGLAESFAIEDRTAEGICLEGGIWISSDRLSEAFAKSDDAVVYTVTVHGYDAIEAAETDMMRLLLLDGWGTALIESAFGRVRNLIKNPLQENGVYSTFAWSPGQHNVDIALQKPLFALLHPEEIGIELNRSNLMHPKKSVSGFFGLGPDAEVESYRPCHFCSHTANCPAAFASLDCF